MLNLKQSPPMKLKLPQNIDKKSEITSKKSITTTEKLPND